MSRSPLGAALAVLMALAGTAKAEGPDDPAASAKDYGRYTEALK